MLHSQNWTAPEGHHSGGQWTFFTAKAQIDGVDMVAGDQLAIFDGAKLVGAFTLTQACNETNMYGNQWIAIEKIDDNGSAVQGYTPGNAYTFKAWKASTSTASPAEGNLLVAISYHRFDGITPTISGTGWELREIRLHAVDGGAHGTANINERMGLAVWTKVAGAAEPSEIISSWDVASDNTLIIKEFTGAGSYTFDVSTSNKSEGTAVNTLSTGTTAVSASAQSLVITALGTRDDGNNMGVPTWTNSIGDNINASGNIRGLHAAYGVHATQDAKESTADWTNIKLAATAIVVFSIAP